MKNVLTHSKRILIGVVGSIVVLAGLIMVPYPGPGWLVVFAGLAILATEFDRAQRILDYAKGKYIAWQNWVALQSLVVRISIWSITVVIVIFTVWLLNGYGIMGQLLGLDWTWLSSPLFH